jgi:hypothetical protein
LSTLSEFKVERSIGLHCLKTYVEGDEREAVHLGTKKLGRPAWMLEMLVANL